MVLASPGAIAIHLGPISIRWYGILMATAIGVGFWLAHREARAEKLPADDILRVTQWAVVAGLIGARLYEVVFNWEYYGQHLEKIVAVWEGGLAIHGGLIVGPLVGAWLARHWRVPILRGLDVVAPSFAIGQAIGRWGNFFNEEAFGRPTDLAWKLYISPPHRPPEFARFDYFHPAFLYESLWDLGVAVLLLWAGRRWTLDNGRLFALYVAAYTAGRAWIEALRVDHANHFLGLRLNDWTSLVVFLAAVGVLVLRRPHRTAGARSEHR